MADIKITFFMIVTDPDITIADYAVQSYAKIQGIPFKLRIYSNWVSLPLRQKYFPAWRDFDFVELLANDWQRDEDKPTDPKLAGPFEKYYTVLDRELVKIETPYFATVDADFEILDPVFIRVMLARLDADPQLVALATDYSPEQKDYYDSYSNATIHLSERWHTWFCIYKREVLECTTPHAYREEIDPLTRRRRAWDSSSYFQQALREAYGFKLGVLDPQYQPCFVHYGAFSKNRHLSEKNIAQYRRLMIWRKTGFLGKGDVSRKVAGLLTKILFGRARRDQYWQGWSQRP